MKVALGTNSTKSREYVGELVEKGYLCDLHEDGIYFTTKRGKTFLEKLAVITEMLSLEII